MKRKLITLIGMFLVIALLLLIVPACAPKAVTVSFYSAAPGGSWYPIAIAAGDVWQKNIPNVAVTHSPGGGVANVIAVDTGDADVGLSTSVSVGDGLLGNPPFEKKTPNVRTLANITISYVTIVVFKDSGITKIEDLKGKRISPGIKGYTVEAVTQKILAAVGLSYDDMAKVEFVSDDDAVDLMKDGHLDAMLDLGSGATGDPGITDLSLMKEIIILEIPDNVLKELQAKSPGLFRGIIPKGSYKGIDADVPVVATGFGFIVNPNVDEDLVYQMVRTLAENWVSDMHPVADELSKVQPQDLAKECGVEIHPGALKYYREVGWIK